MRYLAFRDYSYCNVFINVIGFALIVVNDLKCQEHVCVFNLCYKEVNTVAVTIIT